MPQPDNFEGAVWLRMAVMGGMVISRRREQGIRLPGESAGNKNRL